MLCEPYVEAARGPLYSPFNEGSCPLTAATYTAVPGGPRDSREGPLGSYLLLQKGPLLRQQDSAVSRAMALGPPGRLNLGFWGPFHEPQGPPLQARTFVISRLWAPNMKRGPPLFRLRRSCSVRGPSRDGVLRLWFEGPLGCRRGPPACLQERFICIYLFQGPPDGAFTRPLGGP